MDKFIAYDAGRRSSDIYHDRYVAFEEDGTEDGRPVAWFRNEKDLHAFVDLKNKQQEDE